MATALGPDEVLCPTKGRDNFQRMARLLIGGGTVLLREVFDNKCPPSNLPAILKNPATEKLLKAAKLTQPQRDCLYPSPGVYGKSTDFDITLLFRLLRTICSLTPPAKGWDSLPLPKDQSLEADLARIKFYRNSLFAHVNENMEVSDDEFLVLWNKISEVLVRIADHINPVKKTEWQKAIGTFLKDPLTEKDKRYEQELLSCYQNDTEVKEYMNKVNFSIKGLTETVCEEAKGTNDQLKRLGQELQFEAQGIKDQLGEEIKTAAQKVQCLTEEFQDAVQGIKDHLKVGREPNSSAGVKLRVRIDCEAIPDPNPQSGASGTVAISSQGIQEGDEELVVTGTSGRTVLGSQGAQPESLETVVRAGKGKAVELSTSNSLSQAGGTEIFEGASVESHGIPNGQEVLNFIALKYFKAIDPTKPEERNGYIEFLTNVRKVLLVDSQPGSLILTVLCTSLEILDALWDDYCTGHLNDMAQKYLVTEDILKKFDLTELKLMTTIQKEDYLAARKHFLQGLLPSESEEAPERGIALDFDGNALQGNHEDSLSDAKVLLKMATALGPDAVLCPSKGRDNFQRMARLLISGGTVLFREVFDNKCPPSNLPAILKNPATKKLLKAAKLTKPQWECLYPSPGVYGKSTDFDITLLFRLLRTICSLTPPAKGWDSLPLPTDQSLEADLARIKFYRNSIYGHVNEKMEVSDDDFLVLWKEITEALVRIAGQVNPVKKTEWRKAIGTFLKDPLTDKHKKRDEGELLIWYQSDMEVKECMTTMNSSIKPTAQEVQRLRQELQDEAQGIKDYLGEEVKATAQEVQCLRQELQDVAQSMKDHLGGEVKTATQEAQSLRQELQNKAQGIRDQLKGEVKTATQEVQCLRQKLQDKAQGIKDQLGEEVKTTPQEVQGLTQQFQDEAKRIRDQLEGEVKATAQEVQCLRQKLQDEAQEIRDQLGGEVNTTAQEMQCLGKKLQGDAQETRDHLGGEIKTTAQEVQCLRKELQDEAQDIRDQLGGEVKTATQEVQCLRQELQDEAQSTRDQLRGEEKTTAQEVQCLRQELQDEAQGDRDQIGVRVKTSALEVQCLRQELQDETQDNRDQLGGEVKTTAQEVEFLRQDLQDGAKDPELSTSYVVNQITQKFKQLRQLREDLNKTFIEWIPKRKHTREKLQELATNLNKHHTNVNKATITGASMGTVGGILSIAGLIVAPFTLGAGIAISLVGAGIGGAGGLVMSGSKVTELILTKLGLKEVQEAIDEDREACTQLQEKLEALKNFISTLAEFLKPLHNDAQLRGELEGSGFTFLHHLAPSEPTTSPGERVDFGARFFRIFLSAASISASAFATTTRGLVGSVALAGAPVAHVAGSAVSAAVLPLDIVLLVKSSVELKRGSTSKAVEDIRQILSELECPEEEEIQLMVERFIEEKFTEAKLRPIIMTRAKPKTPQKNQKINLLSNEDYVRVTTSYRVLGRLEEDLINAFRRWIPRRKHTMEKLEELASKLHEHHMNVSKSTVAGASASTLGGILAIVGLITTLFTFGAGLVVSLAGAVIIVAGVLRMSVSKAIYITLAKLGLKKVKETIDEDRGACTQLKGKVDNLEKFISDLRGMQNEGSAFLRYLAQREFTTSTEEKVDFSARFFWGFSSTASIGAGAFAASGTFARTGGLAGVCTANLAGGIVDAVLLPLDIYMLMKSSLEMHKGWTTQAVQDIKGLLSELECPEEEEIQGMVRKFIAEKFKAGDL